MLTAKQEATMVDLDIGLINIQEPADELTLQYLGAKAVVCWKDLSSETQQMLLSQPITGLKATVNLNEQIKTLLRRHGQLDG
jgi:hypothetical protein